MTPEEATLQSINDVIAQLDEKGQRQVEDCANAIISIATACGGYGQIAIALVGATMATLESE